MYLILAFVILSLVCLGISVWIDKKTKNVISSKRLRLEILSITPIENNLYQLTATGEQGIVNFTHNIPFPVGTFIDCDIHDNQIMVYSSNIQKEQIFRVLSKVEKWRYLGIFWIMCAMITAFSQSDKFASLLLSLCAVLAMAFMLILVVRSKAMYDLYNKEEKEQNIVQVDYTILTTIDKNVYVSYINHNNEKGVALLTPKQVKRNPNKLLYHTTSNSILLIPKKRLKITNIASLLLTIIMAVAILIFYLK